MWRVYCPRSGFNAENTADHIVELHKVSGVVHYNVLLFSVGDYDLKLFLHSKLNVDEID